MIFISRKAFENEVGNRMAEIDFRNRIDEKIWKLEEDIRGLRFRLDCLEERNKVPEPKVSGGVMYCGSPAIQAEEGGT